MTLPSRMKALVKPAPMPGAELREVPVPKPGPGEVLVKVRVASICGTDVHIWEWNRWAAARLKPPVIFGHEFAGDVVALGPGVETPSGGAERAGAGSGERVGVAVGDYVSAESHVVCGQCYQCRTGQSHVCQRCSILGVDRAGCFADYVAVPASNVWVNEKDLPPEVASVQEPFGNAVDTVFAGEVPGRSFLVLGCGPIGLMAVALLRASGATPVIAADLSDYRLELARRLGADHAVSARTTDAVAETLRLTGGEGVDAVLEMSGARTALRQALKAARNGGRVAMLGLPSGPVELDLAEDFVFKGLTLQGITGRHIFETWYKTRAFLGSGRVDLRSLITHTFPIGAFREAFELAASGQCGKVVLTF